MPAIRRIQLNLGELSFGGVVVGWGSGGQGEWFLDRLGAGVSLCACNWYTSLGVAERAGGPAKMCDLSPFP